PPAGSRAGARGPCSRFRPRSQPLLATCRPGLQRRASRWPTARCGSDALGVRLPRSPEETCPEAGIRPPLVQFAGERGPPVAPAPHPLDALRVGSHRSARRRGLGARRGEGAKVLFQAASPGLLTRAATPQGLHDRLWLSPLLCPICEDLVARPGQGGQKDMATRVITERLLVRAARLHGETAGCAEDELARLCERRDRLVSELEEVED